MPARAFGLFAFTSAGCLAAAMATLCSPVAHAGQPADATLANASAAQMVAHPGCARAEADAIWARRRVAMAEGQRAQADGALAALLACKLRGGWPAFGALGEAVAIESRAAAAAGDAGRALGLAKVAVEMAPHRPEPWLAVAVARWRQSSWQAAATGLVAWAKLLWREAPLRAARVCAYALWLTFSLSSALVVLAMASLYRYGRPLWHDVFHHLPRRLSPWTRTTIKAAVVLLLALLRLGPLTWALAWLMALGPYMRQRERLATVVGAVGLVAMLAVLPRVTAAMVFVGSEAEAAYLAGRDLDADAEADRLARLPAPGAHVLYILGQRARWGGDLAAAEAYFSRALQAHLFGPDVYTALGNVSWLQYGPKEAIPFYQKALARDANDLVALFNLSQAGLATVTVPQDGARQRAAALNYRQVMRMAAQAKATGLPMAEPAAQATLAQARDVGHDMAVAQLFRPLGGPLPRTLHVVGLGILSFYLLILCHPKVFRHRTTDCRRCGEPICHACHDTYPGRTLCMLCTAIVSSPADADRQVRIDKEIASHRFFQRRLAMQQRFAWMLPGTAHMMRGDAAAGMAFMVVFGVCGLGVGTAYGFVPDPAPAYTCYVGVATALHTALALAVYLVASVHGQLEEA